MRKNPIFSYENSSVRDEELMERLFVYGLEHIVSVESFLYQTALPRFARQHPLIIVDYLNQTSLGDYKMMRDNRISTVFDETNPFEKWDITEFWYKYAHLLTDWGISNLGSLASQMKMTEEVAVELAIRYVETVKFSTQIPYTSVLFRLFSDEVKQTEKFKQLFDLIVTHIKYSPALLRFLYKTPDNPTDVLADEFNDYILTEVCDFLGTYKRVDTNVTDFLLSVFPYQTLLTNYVINEGILPGSKNSDFFVLKLKYSKAIPSSQKDNVEKLLKKDAEMGGLFDCIEDGSFFKYAAVLSYSLKQDEWESLLNEYPGYAEDVILITADDSFIFHPATIAELNKNPYSSQSIRYFKLNKGFDLSYNLYLIYLDCWNSLPLKYKKVVKTLMVREITDSTGVEVPAATPMNWLVDVLKATIQTDGAIKNGFPTIKNPASKV